MTDDGWFLLHGTPLTSGVWDETAAELRSRGPVVCPDVVLPKQDVGVPQLARTLLQQVPPRVRPHLVGHSFGGQVALEMALLAPDRFRSLTLVCSRDTPYPAFLTAAEALHRGDPVDVDAALTRWFRPDELAADGPLVRYARRCVRGADRGSWAAALTAIASLDWSARTPDLAVPLVAVAAEFDQVSTVEAMREMVGRVPQAELDVVAGAGHLSAFLRPALLRDLLVRASEGAAGR